MCHSLYVLFQIQKISHTDWNLECQLWSSFWSSGQQGRSVWVLSQWHRGHFSCWLKLNNTMNISLCALHKHKYHGILSQIWCYFISRNNCEAKALKWRLSEVQIFCDLIHAAVFFHVSRKEQMRELISVRWPAPQQAKARAGEGYLCCSLRSTDDKAKRQTEVCSINHTFLSKIQ